MWNRDESLGIAFGSSVGFILPNGAVRSPDELSLTSLQLSVFALQELGFELAIVFLDN